MVHVARCHQSDEPTKLSNRAALLDNFETMGQGAFLAEHAAIGDPLHRFEFPSCRSIVRLATATAAERLTLDAIRPRVP
jgi:hypothetical protein